jgi:hypothetical protein
MLERRIRIRIKSKFRSCGRSEWMEAWKLKWSRDGVVDKGTSHQFDKEKDPDLNQSDADTQQDPDPEADPQHRNPRATLWKTGPLTS